jgi:GR25 family glycosyltransferase involved in LPS biosynthesis/glycosyltransferase involved in cell wall biosynthesis/SAM-dependent methyltransferase
MSLIQKAQSGDSGGANRIRTIGLCLIVKDEAAIIVRCLNSVKAFVDYVLIEDTGSSDGTQGIIRDWLARENMPGEVIEEPWQNFAYNRSHAMEKLRAIDGVDYALIMDADDSLVLEPGFDPVAYKTAMRDDLYDIQIRHGGSRFNRPQICSNRLPFYFKAVLHEYLEAPQGPISRRNAEGFHIQTGGGGVRARNPRKYQDDAAALEKALETETDPFLISRYTFYLAQSYRDCGEKEAALKNYLKRAGLGFWIEEVFESLYGAAKMAEALNHPDDEVIAAYVRATDALPSRAEALHGAARFCRARGRNEEGFQFAKRGAGVPLPSGGLFVESWIYEYGILDEVGINGYWSGHYSESLEASVKLLGGKALPENQRERVAANARFALEKLPKDPNLGEAGRKNLVDHHGLQPARRLRARIPGAPRVLLAILAKQKEEMLPLYLECIEALDYPKSQIVLYIRTNNNTDRTGEILREWVERVRPLYADVEFDASDVSENVQQFAVHEWNTTRFKVLGHIRNISMQRTLERNCDFYFVADVDNFIRPGTLRELVALNLPLVSPLLRSLDRGRYYSNYHAEVDSQGYFRSSDQYMWILNHWIRGVVEVPVVHTTYLVRADVIPELNYIDETGRHEYVVFSDVARKADVPQYLDNRQVYGYIAFGEGSEHHLDDGIARARALLADSLAGEQKAQDATAATEIDAPTQLIRRPSRSEIEQLSEIHLINLDRSPERLAKFMERNAHLKKVIRVPGVDGLALDRSELIRIGDITEDCPYTAGALGCAMSHIGLWRKAVVEKRFLTIFEDDAVSSVKFSEEMARILSLVPEDWDLIQWGCMIDPLLVWTDFDYVKATLCFYGRRSEQESDAFGHRGYKAQALRLTHSFGIQSYSVTPHGAQTLLNGCLPLKRRLVPFPGTEIVNDDSGIDVAMCAVYPSMNAFVCLPPLVIQDRSLESDRLATDDFNMDSGESDRVCHCVHTQTLLQDGVFRVRSVTGDFPLSMACEQDSQSQEFDLSNLEGSAAGILLLVHPGMTSILNSLIVAIAEGLSDLAIKTDVIDSVPPNCVRRAIVFGANLFPPGALNNLPLGSVIFNVENTSSKFMSDEYKQLLRRFAVWDYDKENAQELSDLIARPVHYFPLFPVNKLCRIPDTLERDIDVLFYGSFNKRRRNILNALSERGLSVKAVFGVYGEELDKLISRSKVVINIHFYDNGRMEMIRLFDLLTNGRTAVAELNPGETIDEDLRDVLVTAPYEQLVDVTDSLVRDLEKCKEVAAAGLRAFRDRNANSILSDALKSSGAPRLPSKAIVGSGKSYDPNFVNIDIEELWKPDVLADISNPSLFDGEFQSPRFGRVRLQRGMFDELVASHVLEHIADLAGAMKNCLDLLYNSGIFHIAVPYDLSYGAWQDPSHLHAFNERSWLYYCEWWWYLGWMEARFDLIDRQFSYSELGHTLARKGCSPEEILRTPRAVDEMRVTLRKRPLTRDEKARGQATRGDSRFT